MRRLVAAVLLLAVGVFAASAQEEEKRPQKPAGVQITFLPPPMEGTLSLGIYTKAGKLVRTLRQEATEKDFVVGLNGFILTWDGKDDAGAPLPGGKYIARGYAVGALDVDGIAFRCNDFITTEESPHIREITDLKLLPSGELAVIGKLVDQKAVEILIAPDGSTQLRQPSEQAAPVDPEGKSAPLKTGQQIELGSLPDLQHPIDRAEGKDGSQWFIDQTAAGTEVKQYAANGEFLRRLTPVAGDPLPKQIAASTNTDRIYLLETAGSVQRVRGLERDVSAAGNEAAALSTWKTLFSKQIVASSEFATVADKLGRPQAFRPEGQIGVRLLPNPLFKDTTTNVNVRAAFDSEGSLLQTADGLPLVRLTETPLLKWVAMGRENGTKAITLFQSDGAVVEEYRAGKLANMMSFDAGEYEWSPSGK